MDCVHNVCDGVCSQGVRWTVFTRCVMDCVHKVCDGLCSQGV